ncbi:MAG: TetR/AcrR family transcriptional regulator [Proteobacteria bacterium]|nr:TetR/AcrR family transcriptional regulator [Pseudomonadota bacterium]
MESAAIPQSSARKGYHHGNLTEALVAAAVALIEESGVEALSVREVAKRAGVSPGAPFRHFESRTALLTAVAEQAMDRFAAAVEQALDHWPENDPVGALRAMGRAYLRWATDNPVHFRVISSRQLIDFSGSARMAGQNAALQETMRLWIERARSGNAFRSGLDTELILLSSRAFVYGLARMWCDDHLRDWHGNRDPKDALTASLDAFIEGLLRAA